MRAVRAAGRARRRAQAGVSVIVVALLRNLLTLAALTAFDWAAWLYKPWAGLVVLGVCLLVLEYAITPDRGGGGRR